MKPKEKCTQVFFTPLGPESNAEEMAAAARRLWDGMKLKKIVTKNALVAIKQHFGEKGGANFVPPAVTRAIGECIRAVGGKPFATDSNTLYNGARSNAVDHLELARQHGFSHEGLGFPVIIADGLRGESQVTLDARGGMLKKVFLAGAGSMAEAAVVLTHVTGHMLSGLGASIKNVGMGFAGRAGKLQQHHSAEPIFSRSQCKACGRCARHCPTGAIDIQAHAILDVHRCIGCGECYAFCPHGAVSFDWNTTSADLQKKMAEYCLAFHEEKPGRVGYLNFITRVTKNCDCMGKGETGLPDLGVVGSFDPVAVDAAAMDLLNAKLDRDVFREFWPQLDPRTQLTHGEKIGLGTTRYELVQA
ncbi:MAG: DUF362 domain-containing protein [Verrucomicrobia bacterium]|nr:DUF362 domain-containing protein [Verrucomicrobiota bacterium]MCG2678496.1 DUF362 domain-containing protein [Kiritimatiellia bacterium]MBU4248002.1 DUF362 domain-containing protein [Verrucomicrobiota bacterium]MBU4289589.1 DUF362 domain-containing protein [Verrucomicrobiota bacterium]MBU4427741.1 DUF362 domain-containing protein [Verrucomicrobiota bacterium]